MIKTSAQEAWFKFAKEKSRGAAGAAVGGAAGAAGAAGGIGYALKRKQNKAVDAARGASAAADKKFKSVARGGTRGAERAKAMSEAIKGRRSAHQAVKNVGKKTTILKALRSLPKAGKGKAGLGMAAAGAVGAGAGYLAGKK